MTPPQPATCDVVERAFSGRAFAYLSTRDADYPGAWRLSIVVDGESGHYPQSHWFAYGTEAEMREVADGLNRDRLRLTTEAVTNLIGQSMRKRRGPYERRA